jgi:hypothetical protein
MRTWTSAGLAVVAGIVAAVLLYAAPPGTDFAEHAFQQHFYEVHGLAPWNNLWYSGRYSFLSYSVVYYPLAAAIGIRPLAILCIVVAVLSVERITAGRWPESSRWVALSAAVVGPGIVLTAEFPFLLGAAAALVAVLALEHRRWAAFATSCLLAAAASPLAFVLLALVVVAFAAGDRWARGSLLRMFSTIGVVAALLVVVARMFPSHGSDPFSLTAYAPAVALAAAVAGLTWRVPAARPLHYGALLNVAACSVIFAVPSEIGEGITRIRAAALPVALLAVGLRRWRPASLCVPLVLLAAYSNLAAPVQSVLAGSDDPAATASYWRPAAAFLRTHLAPSYRVEVVDTRRHWAALYLPQRGIPLVRGWFRQDDFPQNRPLYEALSPRSYRRWLRSQGVEYVVLTDAAPDYSAVREARLLRSGRTGLSAAYRSAHLEVFRVAHPTSIISGPGRAEVLALHASSWTVRVSRPGAYRVAVHYSPYWTPSNGCVGSTGDDMLRLTVRRPGVVHLVFDVTAPALVDALVRPGRVTCSRVSA